MTARPFKSDRHQALSLEFPNDSQRRQATLHYLRPRPAKRPGLVERIRLRVAFAWRAWMKPATAAEVESWADRGMR